MAFIPQLSQGGLPAERVKNDLDVLVGVIREFVI
jgi:hypothetical protein